MRPYQYRCRDYSLLTPIFKQWLVTPFIRFVPWALPANMVTIFSNLFIYLGLYLALNPDVLGDTTSLLLIAACLLLYLIGDHLDGMQAKRTGTSSALGEFCDHYLDAFNNGIVVFTMLTIFDVQNPFIIGVTIAASYIAHMAVFYEQLKTGWLTFEKMGSLEGVLLAAALIALSTLDVVNDLLRYPVINNLTVFEVIMLASALGALLTFIATVKRTPEIKKGFWLFIILFTAVTALGINHLSPVELFVILTLYASLYIGRIMQGHLVDGKERQTDLPTIVFLFLLVILNLPFSGQNFLIATGYLLFCIGLLIVQVFTSLKIYWVWVNAKP
jgi:phosphatidylserine synthase